MHGCAYPSVPPYPHFVKPQQWQTAHPPSCSTAPPHSGHAPMSIVSLCFLPLPLPFPPRCLYLSRAFAIASEQAVILPPLLHVCSWQVMPFSCLMITSCPMFDRSARL